MNYVILSGKYETGTEEQRSGFDRLFGEDVLYRFDLYFHWYNLIHEMGHCFADQSGLKFSGIRQEMFVNEFAVGYYRSAGETRRLNELRTMLRDVIDRIPSPVPAGESFCGFYERIWNTKAITQTMIYGYFQFRSVMEALGTERPFADVAAELGFGIRPANVITCSAEPASSNAGLYLDTAKANLSAFGMNVPCVRLELTDDPTVQCVRCE